MSDKKSVGAKLLSRNSDSEGGVHRLLKIVERAWLGLKRGGGCRIVEAG